MADLPLANYDELPAGTLQHRIRALTEPQLRELIDYEQAHGGRTRVLELLRARLDEVVAGAEPSGGNQDVTPEVSGGRGGSPVREATAAEPGTPLRHGQSDQTASRGRS
ncbi:hypothetical protein [Amycolatopsis sp. NPDC057786]|uniref:hypothetical protein n=1 Tax=Amycolatopsis sp. NPDC057786 TaxID=3346250 RepID=UPI0036715958